MAKEMTKGLFIAFEGPEGCGKSTHSKRLAKELSSAGHEVVHTAEPGGTALGKKIREILLEKEDIHFNSRAELFLFEADRAEHVREVIIPALESRKIVICDRFNTATFAYQGYGLGVDLGLVKAVDDIATSGIAPDMVVLLDIDVASGLKRAASGRAADKMEKRSLDFHNRVRDGYLAIAENDPERIHVIDSAGEIEEVYRCIKERTHGLIERYTRAR